MIEHDIIRTSNLNNVPALLITAGYVTEAYKGYFDMSILSKKCSKCGIVKSASEFSPNKKNKDGLYSACKNCIAAYRRERVKKNPAILEQVKRWAKVNADKMRAYIDKYNDKNRDEINKRKREKRKDPQEKAKIREYNQKYSAVNGDKKRASTKAWQLANPEKNQARMKQWRTENRDKVNTFAHNYRARVAGNGGKITAAEWRWLKEFYDFTCLRCGRREPEIKLTLDHVKPISKGGRNVVSNAQPLCGSCNTAKKDREIDYRDKRRLI